MFSTYPNSIGVRKLISLLIVLDPLMIEWQNVLMLKAMDFLIGDGRKIESMSFVQVLFSVKVDVEKQIIKK